MVSAVQPGIRLLPFDDPEFTWERFESFCLSLVLALPEVRRAAKYGQQGEAQRGIDIEADLHDGRKWTIQCRQRRRFTRANVERTIEDTTYEADEHSIWVTCDVGTAARDMLAELEDWDLKDREDLGQLLRHLRERELARRIVEDAFGSQVRRLFLGGEGPIVFTSPVEYFRRFESEHRLLRHDLPLIGRESEVEAIVTACRDPEVFVVSLVAPGGIGKTRLLRGALENLASSGTRTLIAYDGVRLDAHAADDLPMGDSVVAVDDAHRRTEGLSGFLAILSHRRERPTVVLTYRPFGQASIETAFFDAEIESQQLATFNLTSLEEEAVEELAREALGRASEDAVRLAEATREAPLITVLGGRLLQSEEIEAEHADEELRRLVLERFRAESLGQVTAAIPAETVRGLATKLAAVGPLNMDDEPLIQLLAADLGVSAPELHVWLEALVDAGALVQVGNRVRVYPDILADQLLREAATDRDQRPTAFVNELWSRYGDIRGQQILANIAELDWRLSRFEGSLLEGVWGGLITRFRRADAFGREQLIELVSPAAIHQPAPILQLVRAALEEPARSVTWEGLDITIDDASVREKLPSLLRYAGLHPRYVGDALELLWHLAQGDTRETNPHPDHPLRVISDLGGYEYTLAHASALLELVTRELDRPDPDGALSALDLIPPLLAREGTRSRTKGIHITMSSYLVSAEATIDIRRTVRALLEAQAVDAAPRRRARAAELLTEALLPPHGYFGQRVRDEVLGDWEEDELELMASIERVSETSDDPFVRRELASGLEWIADQRHWSDVATRAQGLRSQLLDQRARLIDAVRDPWGVREPEKQARRFGDIAEAALASHESGKGLAKDLDQLLDDAFDHGLQCEPGILLAHISRRSWAHALGMWKWVVKHPRSRLAGHSLVILDELKRAHGRRIEKKWKRAWKSSQPQLKRVAAAYLGYSSWFDAEEGWERKRMERMLTNDDPAIQTSAVRGLRRLAATHPTPAAKMALSLGPNVSLPDRVRDEVFGAIHRAGIDGLTQKQRETLEKRLAQARELDYHGVELLSRLAKRQPGVAIDIFRARLARGWSRDFEPVPHDPLRSDLLPEDPEARIRQLRRLLKTVGRLGSRSRNGAELFWKLTVDVVGTGSEDAVLEARSLEIDAATDAITSFLDRAKRVEPVTAVLRAMPWQVIVVRTRWVAEIVALGDRLGRKHGRAIAAAVALAVQGAGIGRTIGEPSPHHTKIREAAHSMLAELDTADPARALFSELARNAEAGLAAEVAEDEEIASGLDRV
jgi:hypothetical protein